MTGWPKHPDGRNMTMGEMTREQQREQSKAAVDRVKAQFERAEGRIGVAEALSADPKISALLSP